MVNGVPKISDLGSSKLLAGENKNSPYVVSRIYRAPELIMGMNYELNIDVWSLGVMLFEASTGHTPFNGKTEGLQLVDILEKLGSPSSSEFNKLKKRALGSDQVEWSSLEGIKSDSKFWTSVDKADPSGKLKDLLQKCFKYLPEERISAAGILEHPFFCSPSKKSHLKASK